jgi:DNA-binding response OmpR family regulator
MDVALIQWPSDESLRVELARQEHPRLLLVEPDTEPPICVDAMEDWVRLPVSRADRNARIRALEERSGRRDETKPVVTGDGTLEFRDARTQLSGTQARLMTPLIERFGAVVGRETLSMHTWPGSPTTANKAMDNKLDVTVGRLRRQILPLGLTIRTVRSRGYLLCDADPA